MLIKTKITKKIIAKKAKTKIDPTINFDEDELMTEEELRDFLKVSRFTMLEMRKSGDAPEHMRIGYKTKRYLKRVVLEWLDSKRVTK